MKRMILLVVMIAGCFITAGAQTTKVSDKTSVNGNNYTTLSTRTSSGATPIKTGFTWSNAKDNISYDIYLHQYSKGDNAGKWTCYVLKKSAKTGKEYKYYLPDGMAIAEDIIKRNPNLIK